MIGTSFNKRSRKWIAYIESNGKQVRLGYFSTQEEATQARLDAEAIYGKPKWGGRKKKASSRIWLGEDGMALVEVFPHDLALIDTNNIEKVREGRRWHILKGYIHSTDLKCCLHQHILGTKGNGHILETDHIDRNPLNNLESNLRLVTHSENLFNTELWKHNTSGVKGVTWDRENQKWRAQIKVYGRNRHLGRFTNREDAIKARQEAEVKLGFGED